MSDGAYPFVLWLSGLDKMGFSSIKYLFFLNGPYKILNFPGPFGEDTLKMAQNPFKWNIKADFVWLDQPAGAGWSYSNTSEATSNVEDAAVDLCEFLTKFFERYPNFAERQLVLAGDGMASRI